MNIEIECGELKRQLKKRDYEVEKLTLSLGDA